MPTNSAEYTRLYYAEHREEILASQRTDEHRDRCREYYAQNTEKIRAQQKEYRSNLWRRGHGADIRQWCDLMLDVQNGLCYLCQRPLDDDFIIEHDHSVGCHPKPGSSCADCRRGLACSPCNKIIGLAGENPELLHRIACNLAERKSSA